MRELEKIDLTLALTCFLSPGERSTCRTRLVVKVAIKPAPIFKPFFSGNSNLLAGRLSVESICCLAFIDFFLMSLDKTTDL